jgi:hypothetical protein
MQSTSPHKRYILFVLVGMLATIIFLFALPKDRLTAFTNMRQDYIKGRWYFDRLFRDARPIDVAFIGTSHTNGGIEDGLVERVLQEKHGHKLHVANLGLPEHGRNLHYMVTRDLFENKSPQLLVLEVKAYESRKSHHLFGRLARVDDIVRPAATINAKVFRDVLSGLRWQLEQYILPEPLPVYDSLPNHGFHNNDKGVRLTASEMEQQVEKRKKVAVASYLGDRWDAIEFIFPRYYVSEIVELARSKGTQIAFIYLPYYGAPPKPRDYERYQQVGEVWLPPNHIMDNPAYWKDFGHLNTWGAAELAPWLASQVDRAHDP